MSNKKIKMEVALQEVFDKIKPSNLPKDIYNKFRIYRNRYKKGELNDKAIRTLLLYFGYIQNPTTYTYKKENDQSLSNK